MRIYRVTRRTRTYYIRACDSVAIDTLATQFGFPVQAIVRAPGMSRKAINMSEFAIRERNLRKHHG